LTDARCFFIQIEHANILIVAVIQLLDLPRLGLAQQLVKIAARYLGTIGDKYKNLNNRLKFVTRGVSDHLKYLVKLGAAPTGRLLALPIPAASPVAPGRPGAIKGLHKSDW
jgi:hypothetical protein